MRAPEETPHLLNSHSKETEEGFFQQGAAMVPKYTYKVQAGSRKEGNSALLTWLSIKLYSNTCQSAPSLATVLGLSPGALCPPHSMAQSHPDHTPPLPASNMPSTYPRLGGSDVSSRGYKQTRNTGGCCKPKGFGFPGVEFCQRVTDCMDGTV